jgi:hypothetical protein
VMFARSPGVDMYRGMPGLARAGAARALIDGAFAFACKSCAGIDVARWRNSVCVAVCVLGPSVRGRIRRCGKQSFNPGYNLREMASQSVHKTPDLNNAGMAR